METDRAIHIFERLSRLVLDLPRDPVGLGPDFLREQISLCRNYLNEVSHYYQEILRERTLLSMDLDAKEAAFQMRSDELLASDTRVTTLPSVADRQAMVNVIASQDRRVILDLQQRLRAVSHIERVIKHRKEELDNTMSAIRLQRSLLKDQLKSLQGYGDETETSRNDPADQLSGADLDALLSEAEAEIDLEASKSVTLTEEASAEDADSIDLEQLLLLEEEASSDVTFEPAQDVGVGSVEEPKVDMSDLDVDMQRFLDEEDSPDLDAILESV